MIAVSLEMSDEPVFLASSRRFDHEKSVKLHFHPSFSVFCFSRLQLLADVFLSDKMVVTS